MKLISWNIQWGRGIDGRVDLARSAAWLKAADAEVIALQEVAIHHESLPGAPQGDQFALLRELLPGYEAVFAPGSDLADGQGGRRQFGQAVFSRRPILQVFRHLLPWPADPQTPSMQRVALEAVIERPKLPGGALRVITTHLEYYSAVQRRAQVAALRAIHAEGWQHGCRPRSNAESDTPFAVLPRGQVSVICGDCNFSPEMPEYAQMQQAYDDDTPRLIDAWVAIHPGQPHAPTAGVHRATFTSGPACYDFCFVSENLAPWLKTMSVDELTDASDHQPVTLELVSDMA